MSRLILPGVLPEFHYTMLYNVYGSFFTIEKIVDSPYYQQYIVYATNSHELLLGKFEFGEDGKFVLLEGTSNPLTFSTLMELLEELYNRKFAYDL